MSRPLTIGERQKLRTKEQRQASALKGIATKRRNKALREAAPSLWSRIKGWFK